MGNQGKDRILYRFHKKFVETERYSADLAVSNSSYSFGPYYLTLVESMGFPVDIRTSIRKAGKSSPGRFIKGLLSERKAELRLSGSSVTGNEFLKKQISDLERMLIQYEKDEAIPLDVTFMLRVYADHPAILNARLQRVKNLLGMLGIEVSDVPVSRRSLSGMIIPEKRSTYPYLMNSRDVAQILPVYREPYEKGDGIVIGIDDLTERFVYYNPFSQNSYNSLVIGETGSGKSYFTKLLLTRSLKTGMIENAIIFDPLNEYSCRFLGSGCIEQGIENFLSGKPRGEVAEPHCDTGSGSDRNPAVIVIKPIPDELEDEELISRLLNSLNSRMMADPGNRTMIIIDECHIILRNNRNGKLLSSMVRHSRHYNTSIVNISQNTDDFLNERSGSIAFNSNRIFIFRTRNIKDAQKKVLKLEGFDHEPPERLMGGKMHPYSECIFSDGEFCRKLRILSSTVEDSVLQRE